MSGSAILVVLGFFIGLVIYLVYESHKEKKHNEEVERRVSSGLRSRGIDVSKMSTIDRYYAREEQKKLGETIVRTRIWDENVTTSSRGSVTSAAARAAVGTMIAGPIGGIVGASTAKTRYTEKKETVFKIWYADGHTEVKTVENGTQEWRELMDKLEE